MMTFLLFSCQFFLTLLFVLFLSLPPSDFSNSIDRLSIQTDNSLTMYEIELDPEPLEQTIWEAKPQSLWQSAPNGQDLFNYTQLPYFLPAVHVSSCQDSPIRVHRRPFLFSTVKLFH